MNKAQKNIVVIGFTEDERRSLGIPYIEKGTVRYLDSLSEATKYQGYMLIYDNSDKKNIVGLDKKYRKTFNRFEVIWFFNESYNWDRNKYSRIVKVNREIFDDISYSLAEEWDEYKLEKEQQSKIELSSTKMRKINELYNYLKSYKNIKTSKIVEDLKWNERAVERYMYDLNSIYHNIGYDYSNNEWYFIW